MPANETKAFLHLSAMTLASPLHEAMGYAISVADQKMVSYRVSGAKYRGLHSYLVRVGVREFLLEEGLPDSWEIAGNPELSGQLKFLDQQSGWQIRFLKESPVTTNRVPLAGANKARRQIWTGDLFSSAGVDHSLGRVIREDELLMLWNLQNQDFGLRVVHTIGPGKFQKTVPVNYSLDLVVSGNVHENRRFDPDNSEENLVTEAYIENSEFHATGSGEF